MQRLKSERGSMFVGIMTLITVGVLLHTIFMRTYWFQTQYYLQERFSEDAASFASQTRMLLADRTVCSSIFAADVAVSEEIFSEKDSLEKPPIFSGYGKLIFGEINFPRSMKIKHVGVDRKAIAIGPDFELRYLDYILSPAGQIGYPKKVRIPVYFNKNLSGEITSCYATALVDEHHTVEDDICDILGKVDSNMGEYNPPTGLCKPKGPTLVAAGVK